MTEQNEHFPTALQAILLVLALFVVELLVGMAFRGAQGVLALTSMQSEALMAVVANGCLFAFVMQHKGLTYRSLFQPSGEPLHATLGEFVVPVVMLVPALVLGVSVLVGAVTEAFPLSDSQKALFDEMAGDDLAATLMACVIAPVVEEMFFRGIVLRSFLHQYGRVPSIVGSALLFGAAHLNIYQGCSAVMIGSLSGWLYARVRSLVPCIALHASFNTALTLLGRMHNDSPAPSDGSAGDGALTIWLGSLVLAGVGALYLARALARREDIAAR